MFLPILLPDGLSRVSEDNGEFTPIGIKSNGVFSAQHQIDMGVVGLAGWCLGLVDDLDIIFMIDEGAGAT